MMKIMIHREGKDYGPYSLQEVRDMVSLGTILDHDMAWAEGSEGWVPLKDLLAATPPGPPGAPVALAPEESTANRWSTKAIVTASIVGAVFAVLLIVSVIELSDTFSPFLSLLGEKAITATPSAGHDHAGEVSFTGMVTLPSGLQIQTLSVKQEENEGRQVLCLHYVSHVDIHNAGQLNPEVDQVWPWFKDQAEKSGLNWAVISPTKIDSTFPAEVSEYENYYYKKTDGNWELDFPKH